MFNQLKAERVKGLFYTNKGWFIINGVDGSTTIVATSPSTNSRIEMIGLNNQLQDISTALKQCLIERET